MEDTVDVKHKLGEGLNEPVTVEDEHKVGEVLKDPVTVDVKHKLGVGLMELEVVGDTVRVPEVQGEGEMVEVEQ